MPVSAVKETGNGNGKTFTRTDKPAENWMPLVEPISTLKNKLCEQFSVKVTIKLMHFSCDFSGPDSLWNFYRTGYDFLCDHWPASPFYFFTELILHLRQLWAAHGATSQAVKQSQDTAT